MEQLTEILRTFIKEHAADDLSQLLLSAARYPAVDVPFAVNQIESRRAIKDKLPTWFANEELIFSSKVAAEQCSSELAAMYKQRLLNHACSLCDLTGGMGVDSYYFSQIVDKLLYVERNKDCYDAAMHNFAVLSACNIEGRCDDATHVLSEIQPVDVLYIDPARRNAGKRVFALSDCEPDLLSLLPQMLQKSTKIIAKLSPMLDLQHTLSLLPQTVEIHVVSVKNECKELLFVLGSDGRDNPDIHCVNLLSGTSAQLFHFSLLEEATAPSVVADTVQSYLYEPNSSLLKAGAYKLVAVRTATRKLHVSSHLYTSNQLNTDFPGRVFRVDEILPFHNSLCKKIARTIPRANIAVRNFPLTVEELRRRTKIEEGGLVYLFGTTMADGQKVLIRCSKITTA